MCEVAGHEASRTVGQGLAIAEVDRMPDVQHHGDLSLASPLSELQDSPGAVKHREFQDWRAANPDGVFLTLATKTVLMLVAGPLLGLAFVFALPVASVMLTAYYGAKLLAAHWARIARQVKNVALFFAAPFIGLAYMIALPFVGFGTLVYFAVKAARK